MAYIKVKRVCETTKASGPRDDGPVHWIIYYEEELAQPIIVLPDNVLQRLLVDIEEEIGEGKRRRDMLRQQMKLSKPHKVPPAEIPS